MLNLCLVCCINLLHTAFSYCILYLFIVCRIYLLHTAFIYCKPYIFIAYCIYLLYAVFIYRILHLFIAYCIYFCILQMKKVSLKCKKSLKIPKEQSKSVIRRMTDKTMAKRKKKNIRTSNDLQNITHIIRDRETCTPLKS